MSLGAQARFEYQLFHYPQDGSVEMYDMRNRRAFLRRTKPRPELSTSELYPGNVITLFSRQLSVTSYGDDRTRARLASSQQRALMLLPQHSLFNAFSLIHSICHFNHLALASIRSFTLSSPADAERLAPSADDNSRAMLSNGTCIAAELVGESAIERVRSACFSSSGAAIAACDDEDTTKDAINFVHSSATSLQGSATLRDCTLGIVKPHAVKRGVACEILEHVQHQLGGISAVQSFRVSKANSGEFLEVYKGVLPEYSHMVDELSAGMCIAFEVSANATDYKRSGEESVVEALREACGPLDPEIARVLRPRSVRAKFGIDKVKNAVHCTDLEDDGPLESEYFFSVLAGDGKQ